MNRINSQLNIIDKKIHEVECQNKNNVVSINQKKINEEQKRELTREEKQKIYNRLYDRGEFWINIWEEFREGIECWENREILFLLACKKDPRQRHVSRCGSNFSPENLNEKTKRLYLGAFPSPQHKCRCICVSESCPTLHSYTWEASPCRHIVGCLKNHQEIEEFIQKAAKNFREMWKEAIRVFKELSLAEKKELVKEIDDEEMKKRVMLHLSYEQKKNDIVNKKLDNEQKEIIPFLKEEKPSELENEKEENNNSLSDQKTIDQDEQDSKNIDYQSWTLEQFITEINRLKTENEELKNNSALTASEKENRIEQNQQLLEKLESKVLNSSISDNNSKSTSGIGIKGWIGITVIVGLVGLVVAMVIKKKRKIKSV